MKIPFINLVPQRARLKDRIDEAVSRVMDSGNFILGPEVELLEERLAAHNDAPYCVTCANGTDALILALLALDIGPGDYVACPSFTYVATAEAIQRVGAIPLFIDVDFHSFTLCPLSLKAVFL